MAPAVPSADSRPTVAPVSPRSVSCSLTTVGVTADRTAAGAKKPTKDSDTIATGPAPRSVAPTMRTSGMVHRASAPPSSRIGPSVARGSTRSARRPPAHVPSEMPASTVPMIPV